MSELEKNLYKRVTVPPKQQDAVKGRAYRGFSTVDNTSKGFARYDFELIKQDLINHFHIRQGEKLSDPGFGTIIWDMLFEPFTSDVQDAIVEDVTKIVNYDPRLGVDEIIVDTYEKGITVECTIVFLPYNISEQLRFTFDQANGLL
jgi:phage baseplate assembly protein W|tara:strand:- start:11732 stop:12169 length:438 start_codon:yes stop_codon:yes gene_type:complete